LQAVVLGQDFAVTSSEDGSIKVVLARCPHAIHVHSILVLHQLSPLQVWNTNVRFRSGEEPSVKFTCVLHPCPALLLSTLSLRAYHTHSKPKPWRDTASCISFSELGSRSPYTLSHLSVDGRFLLTWGPQRGLQLLDLELRAVVFTVPASHTGVLDAVFCGAQAPADAAAAGATAIRTLMFAPLPRSPHLCLQVLCPFK
jgi:hypothetical protein